MVALLATIALAVAIIGGAWLLGGSVAPTQADAGAERDVAFEQAYDDSRSAAYAPAYEAAWQEARTASAAQGRREGAKAGAVAARRVT